MTYASALVELTQLEAALQTLVVSMRDVLDDYQESASASAAFTSGEVVVVDTLVAILFSLCSRLRKIFFILPETIAHDGGSSSRDAQEVWSAWSHHFKDQKWNFDVLRNGALEIQPSEKDDGNTDVGGPQQSGTAATTTSTTTRRTTAHASLALHQLSRLANFSQVHTHLHHIHFDPSEIIINPATAIITGTAFHPKEGNDTTQSPLSSLQRRWRSLTHFEDAQLPYGFTGEALALSLQQAVALLAATIIHVCDGSFLALNKDTIWVIVTVVVLGQKSVSGVVMRAINRVMGTAAAGLVAIW